LATIDPVQVYRDALPERRRERFDLLQRLILGLYPDAEVSMRYRMPTYSWGDGWIALGNQKGYFSVYTCGAQHLGAFKQRHPRIKTGKGCINLRDSDPLPMADLKEVIHSAMKASRQTARP
jgi:uncharacterized protein YdhG (YjbR/CyaY superfamily)